MSSKSEKGFSAYRKLHEYQTVKILYNSKYLDFRTFMATLTDYILLIWARVKTALTGLVVVQEKSGHAMPALDGNGMACLLLFPQNKFESTNQFALASGYDS